MVRWSRRQKNTLKKETEFEIRLCPNTPKIKYTSMTENAANFMARSTVKAEDLDHRKKINFNIGRYNAVVPQGKQQFDELNLARERAKNIKWRAIETLDKTLEEFEDIFTQRGGRVIWAEDTDQALAEILAICKEKNCRSIVKSKSMVTEEIQLHHS